LSRDDGGPTQVARLDLHVDRVGVGGVAADRDVVGELLALDRHGDEPGLGRLGVGSGLSGRDDELAEREARDEGDHGDCRDHPHGAVAAQQPAPALAARGARARLGVAEFEFGAGGG
jgi:hypothetical protein